MWKINNNNKVVILLLVIIIVILSLLCILFATETISFNSITSNEFNQNIKDDNKETVKYDYKSIKGLYKYIGETMKDENGNEFNASYNLYLYENGTFNYAMGTFGPFGYIGNYIIENNNIILNYLFSTNSGAGIDVTSGSKIITINNNNTLVDVNQSINIVNMTSVTLKKATFTEENEFLQDADFSNILKNYHIINNVSN